MSNRAWMPLDIGDYLEDTGHLTTVQHGAYMLLIMEYWKRGGLPDDDRKLAAFARMTPDQWAEHRDTIADFFQPGWKHKRIDAEMAKADEIIEKRRAAADARHGRSKSNASAMQVQSKSNADGPYTGALPSTIEPSSSLRSDEPAARKRGRPERLPEDWRLPNGWGQDAIDAGLPASLIDLEASKMRDWSRSSKNGAKLDWRAAWRNWCREAAARTPQTRSPPPKANPVRDVIHQLRSEMGAPDDQSRPSAERDRQAPLSLPAAEYRRIG